MLITELIKQLNQKLKEDGDLEVIFVDMDYQIHNTPHITTALNSKTDEKRLLLVIE